MAEIVIREIDETSPGLSAEQTDIVFIPGFVNPSQDLLDSDGNYVLIGEPLVPTLCTTVAEFQSYFGKTPAIFATNQLYSDLLPASFAPPAVPDSGVMFYGLSQDLQANDGKIYSDRDPGYIFAKQLLNLGLPVVYERVNSRGTGDLVSGGIVKSYKVLNRMPSDWVNQTGKYGKSEYFVYDQDEDGYVTFDSVSPVFESNKYYQVKGQTGSEQFVLITECPQNWHNNMFYEQKTLSQADFVDEEPQNWDTSWSTYYSFLELPNSLQAYQPLTQVYKDVPNFSQLTVFSIVDGSDTVYVSVVPKTTGLVKSVQGVAPKFVFNKYYQDVNGTKKLLTKQPHDWYSRYSSYYVLSDNTYTNVTSVAPQFDTDKYYWYTVSTDTYTVLQDEPQDWAEKYDSYYEVQQKDSQHLYGWKSGDYFREVNYDVSIKSMYEQFNYMFDELKDKGEYSVKYVTSGGYPTYEYNKNLIVSKMLDLCESRGDCVAFIDHTDNPDRTLDPVNPRSVYYRLNATEGNEYKITAGGEYGTMFTPWFEYITPKTGNTEYPTCDLPASYGYFTDLAVSLKNNPSWYAIAGVTRGLLRNYVKPNLVRRLTNAVADAYQPRNAISLNAITNIKPYGYTIWGNRTLKNNSVAGNLIASSFLNIRNMVSDVKKVVYRTCKQLMFEQNDDILWINFVNAIKPTLDRMSTSSGLKSYKILKGYPDGTMPTEKGKLAATIRLIPIYAVQSFDVTIVLTDDDVTIS